MLRGFLPRAAGLAVVAALTLTAVTGTVAQDAPAPEAAPAPVQHPADIRLGSCAALGDIVAPLNAAIAPTGDPQGQAGATPVEQSVTEIPVALADLLATGHAIAVHPSPEQVGTPIACGEIGGAVGDDGALAVGLTAANGSKVSGTASFAPIPETGGTVVSLFVVDERAGRRGGGGAEATGEPAVGGGAENEPAATDNASGENGAAPAAAPKPASAPATEPATAGLEGVSTISASNEDGKNAKPARNRDKSKADRDANGNAGNATTNSNTDTNSGDGERGNREGRARAGEDR